jgi:release factor glutamine methyltransferase
VVTASILRLVGVTRLSSSIELNVPRAPAAVPSVDLLRPSEYTAALIQTLRSQPERMRGARVLEMGCGSGVVLAALGALGASGLCGVDVEHSAIEQASNLLDVLGYGHIAELYRGDMWRPVKGRSFDLVVANLPHFPTDSKSFPGRFPSWSWGGTDGRDMLDRFLGGLAEHLVPGGRAVITHNAFVGLERSRDIVHRRDLVLRVVKTTMVHISGEKLDCMTSSVLHDEKDRSIHRYGPYAFGEMHIVEIGAPRTIG